MVDANSFAESETVEEQVTRALRNCAFFEGLNSEVIESLVREASLKRVSGGAILFLQGDDSRELYIIASGRIRLYRVSPDGVEKTLAVHGEYDMFGGLAAIDGLGRSATAEAMNDAEVVEISGDAFLACLEGSWNLSQRLIRKLSQMLRKTDESLDLLAFASARARVASALAKSSDRHGRVLSLTHRDIAAIASTSRETVSRVIGDLVDSGMVALDDGEYIIIDMDRLMHLDGVE